MDFKATPGHLRHQSPVDVRPVAHGLPPWATTTGAQPQASYSPASADGTTSTTGEFVEGGQRLIVDRTLRQIPVYVPEGSIIYPSVRRWNGANQKKAELINLIVYEGRDADFQLYEERGHQLQLRARQVCHHRHPHKPGHPHPPIGKRQGAFDGYAQEPRFNIVTVSKAQPRALDLDNPEGKLVTLQRQGRNGEAVTLWTQGFSHHAKGRTNVTSGPFSWIGRGGGGS